MATHKSDQQNTEQDQKSVRSRHAAVNEDLEFQQKQWRAERVGWLLMITFIVCALAGVFGGGGPLAKVIAVTKGGDATVQYHRFVRQSNPTTLEVGGAGGGGTGPIRLRISEEYLSDMTVHGILPPPLSTALADRHYVFVFERSAVGPAANIRFQLEPTSIGASSGWVAIDNGAPVSFTQFVYP